MILALILVLVSGIGISSLLTLATTKQRANQLSDEHRAIVRVAQRAMQSVNPTALGNVGYNALLNTIPWHLSAGAGLTCIPNSPDQELTLLNFNNGQTIITERINSRGLNKTNFFDQQLKIYAWIVIQAMPTARCSNGASLIRTTKQTACKIFDVLACARMRGQMEVHSVVGQLQINN